MLTKIVLTLLVIVICFWTLAARNKPTVQLREIPNPAEVKRKKLLRNSAFVFMGLMILAAGVMIYFELSKQSDVMIVEVINTQTGDKQTYRASREDISDSQFITISGKTVFVADIERIEVERLIDD